MHGEQRGGRRTRTGKVALVDEAASFVDDLDGVSEGCGNGRGQGQTQSPKMAILACVSLSTAMETHRANIYGSL